MPDRKYTKVEEEIIQILDRMEDDAPKQGRPHLRLVHSARTAPARRTPRMPRLPSLSPGLTLGLVFAFAFVALMTSGIVQIVATVLSIGCFVLLFVRRNRAAPASTPLHGSKTWRGRDIVLSPDNGASLGGRVRDWLSRVRR